MKKSERLTEEKLLRALDPDRAIHYSIFTKRKAYEQLREMIQQKPRVSRDEVDNLIWEVHRYSACGEDGEVEIQYKDEMMGQVIERLEKRFGVEVTDEKD